MAAVINSPPQTPVDTQDGQGVLRPPSEGWRAFFNSAWVVCNSLTESGDNTKRPTSLLWPGRRFFDITLGAAGEPIWRNKDNTGWVGLAAGSGSVTTINTTAPIVGGPITTTGTISIDDAAADGVTKGAAAFVASDFNAAAGVISIDYVNGQKATAAQPGFLTAADWSAFSAAASMTPGHVIEDEGTPLTQRANMNFVGAGVTATDAGGKTVVTIPGAGTTSLAVGTTPITSGTAGRVLFEGAGNVLSEDAGLTYDASTDALTTTLLTLGVVSSATGQLKLANSASANLTTIQAGNALAARTYTWPTDFGASGTVLTDAAGNGTLSWTVPTASSVRLDQITTGTADSTLTTSGTISMTSGVGAANTAGKTISIQPGAGGATTAAGGLLSLTGGTGTGNGIAGGAVTITGGTAAGSATTGGAVNLVGGTGILGGAVNLTSGASTTSGTAGAVVILAASGVGTNSIGGAITLTAGASNNAQVGGVVTITAGAGGSTGGAVTVRAGGGVIGGAVSVLGGTPTAGAGGAVNITGAAGVGTNMAGGNVILRPGAATGSGNPGNIQLDGGRGAALATTATGGFVTIPTCAGTPSGTPVNVPTGSVPQVFDTTGVKLWTYTGGAWTADQPLDADLTTIAGLTATTDNFMQAKSSAWASRTVAQVSVDLQATGLITDAVGFRTVPQNSQSTAYTAVAADSGKHLLHPSADTTARTFTIPSNASVAYPIGTEITFVNQNAAGVMTIAITTDTMRLAPGGTTGSRTLAANGVATALKLTATEWIIRGSGLT